MKKPRLALLLLSLLASGAHASSDDAWAEYDTRVATACSAASTLKQAKPAGGLAHFDDRVGYTAVLIAGRYRPAHMKNRQGSELCLYDKKTGTAYVTEWAPPAPAAKR